MTQFFIHYISYKNKKLFGNELFLKFSSLWYAIIFIQKQWLKFWLSIIIPSAIWSWVSIFCTRWGSRLGWYKAFSAKWACSSVMEGFVLPTYQEKKIVGKMKMLISHSSACISKWTLNEPDMGDNSRISANSHKFSIKTWMMEAATITWGLYLFKIQFIVYACTSLCKAEKLKIK